MENTKVREEFKGRLGMSTAETCGGPIRLLEESCKHDSEQLSGQCKRKIPLVT